MKFERIFSLDSTKGPNAIDSWPRTLASSPYLAVSFMSAGRKRWEGLGMKCRLQSAPDAKYQNLYLSVWSRLKAEDEDTRCAEL